MKKLKEKLNHDKKLKYGLFFGFYLVFFITLIIIFKIPQKEDMNSKQDINNKETVTLTTIHNLFDNDFTYHFEIEDDGNKITFDGSKENIDYNEYPYKYFLNYININQLIKKSKLINSDQVTTYYELENRTLNELLNTDIIDGINKITEINGSLVNNNLNEYSINLDLSAYMQKKKFIIKLNYKVGGSSE